VTDRATRYAEAVVRGDVLACRLVTRSAQRHLDDLAEGEQRGLRFSPELSERAAGFYTFLRHVKGEWARGDEPIRLEPWQQFIVGSLFGWQRRDPESGEWRRRYRTAYVELPRKNAKSTLASGIGLLLAFFDDEPGAEVYVAATKRDQARIVWGDARQMVMRSPPLRRRISVLVGALYDERTASRFTPLGADADSLDGLNLHGAIVDELHAHRGRTMVDVLETATGARRQPLILYITTAGADRRSVCWERHRYTEQVLDRVLLDDSLFGFIAHADDPKAWADEEQWARANPNLGVSVKLDDLRAKALRATNLPTELNAFLRLHLDLWTETTTRWITRELWTAQETTDRDPRDLTPLYGRRCFGGLDLSATRDLCAWVLIAPVDEPGSIAIDVFLRVWCSESWARSPENLYSAQYQAWERNGWLTFCPGDAIDYDAIEETVLDDIAHVQLVDMNLDRLFQGYAVGQSLAKQGVRVFGFPSTMAAFTPPMKELERRLAAKVVRHNGHPILGFAIDSLSVTIGKFGGIAPDKATSDGKIDAAVTLTMALDRLMRNEPPKEEIAWSWGAR